MTASPSLPRCPAAVLPPPKVYFSAPSPCHPQPDTHSCPSHGRTAWSMGGQWVGSFRPESECPSLDLSVDPGRALSLLDLSILQYKVQMGGLLRPAPWLVMGIDCSALCYHALSATGSCTRLQGWQVLSVPTPTAPPAAGWDEGFSLLSWLSDQDRQPGPLTSFPEHRVNTQGPLFRRGNSGSEKMQESEAVCWSGVGRCWWGWGWGGDRRPEAYS